MKLSKEKEANLTSVGFDKEINLIHQDKCPICERDIMMVDFRDDLSLKEYKISGMCQYCQDKVFD